MLYELFESATSGRKLPKRLENPVDNFFIFISENTHMYYKKLGFTPNGLTILSLLIQIIGIYAIFKNQYYLGGFLWLFGYHYDVMDGWYARKYKMTSKYGDMLDHATDIIAGTLLVVMVLLHTKLTVRHKVIFIVSSIVLLLLMSVYLGCQEKYVKIGSIISNQISSDTLGLLQGLCDKNEEKKLEYLRYFGAGSYSLFVFLFFAFIQTILP